MIKNDKKKFIFNFGLILERVKQIHIMENSFKKIIEVLNTKSKNFIYTRLGVANMELICTIKRQKNG